VALEDKTLVCNDCGREFAFTTGEQEFFQSHGLMNDPKRCPECRSNRRRERGGRAQGSPRPTFTTTCSACGVETTVPFEPTQGRPVYCKDCYTKNRESK